MFHACIWDNTTGSFQELYLPVFVLAFWNRILDTISMFRSLLCTVILAVFETTHSRPNADNNDICTNAQCDNSYFRTIVRNSVILYRRDRPKVNVQSQDQQPNIDKNHEGTSLFAYLLLIVFCPFCWAFRIKSRNQHTAFARQQDNRCNDGDCHNRPHNPDKPHNQYSLQFLIKLCNSL